MLRLLRMKNFGCRAELSLDFTTGVVGIVGPNGCGKSTICDAIRLIFLGNVTRPGVKLDNINWKSGPRAHSYVAADLLIKGQEVSVERYLRGGKTSLTIHSDDGSEPVVVYGEVPVTDRLSALMGVSPKQLDDVCFQSQEELFGLVGAKRDRRLEFFQRLFDLAAAASGYQALGDALKQVVVSDESAAVDQLRASLEESQARLAEAEAQLAAAPNRDDLLRYQAAATASLAAIEAAKAAAVRLGVSRERCAQDEARLNVARLALSAAESCVQQIEAEEPERQYAEAQRAEVELSRAVDDYNNYVRSVKQCESVIAHNDKQRMELKPPVKPSLKFGMFLVGADGRASDALRARVRAELANVQETVKALTQGTVCPTCHTQLRDFDASLVAAMSRRADRLAKVEAALASSSHRLAVFVHEYQKYSTAFAGFSQQVEWAQANLAAIATVAAPSGDVAALRVRTAECEQRCHELRRLRLEHIQAQSAAREAEAVYARSAADVARDLAEATAVPAALLAEEPQLRQGLEATAAALSHVAALAAVLQERRGFVERTNQLWLEGQARQRRNAKLQRLHDQLTRVRGYLHRESLPAIGVGRNIASIERMMNQMLLAYSADFSIEITSDLDLVAKFTDPETLEPLAVSSDRLSGGQKVTLALAFRLAAHAAIRHSCPLLVLDEPTAFLDKERIEGVYLVFEESRRIASAFHSQYIVVTHETALLPVFDQKIELGSLWSAPKA